MVMKHYLVFEQRIEAPKLNRMELFEGIAKRGSYIKAIIGVNSMRISPP